MHIKEICLEGFKSYVTRTVVPGFDPHFNAITGLNGSGKSNILDSICFVLGITNLQQVRAASLQELVYKQGQAGITKATVSVTFDNSEVNKSPLGYEQHSEITVTRQIYQLQGGIRFSDSLRREGTDIKKTDVPTDNASIKEEFPNA